MDINQTNMLPTQQPIQFSHYSSLYDLIIPTDNLLRRINDLIDFSFIRKEEQLFDFNKDAGMFVCPAGHMAIRRARHKH